MAGGIKLATAWVDIVPSTAGVGKAIGKAFGSYKSGADGKKAGSEYSKGVGGGLSGLKLGALSGIFSSLTSSAIGLFSGIGGEIVDASDATDKFKSTLDFAGIDSSGIDKLTKSTQAYADATVYDLGDIQNVTAQLASNGVKGYDTLAEAAGNLNAVAGGNADTFKSVGMVLTQTAGQGKLTTENFNQLADAIPGASGKLQEALKKNGAYAGNFRDAMAKGQITAAEFNKAVSDLGMTDAAKKAATSTKTIEGAWGNLQATVVGIGKNTLDQVKPFVTDAMGAVSNALPKVVDGFKTAVGWAQQNQEWLKPLAVGIATIATAIGAYSAATKIAAGVQAAFNAVMALNPVTAVALAIAGLVAGLVYFFTQTKTGQQIWAGFIGWLQAAWTGIGTFFQNLWNGITQVFWGAVDGIKSFLSSTVGQIITVVFAPFIGIPNLIIQNWGGITAFFSGLWAGIQAVWGGVTAWFSGLWSAALAGIKSIWNGVVSFFSGIWNGIVAVFSVAASFYKGVFSSAWNGIKGVWSAVTGFFSGVWNGIKSVFSGVGSTLGGFFRTAWNTVKSVWSGVTGFFSGIKNGIVGVFSSIGDAITAPFRNAFGAIKSLWNSTIGGKGFTLPSWIPGGLGGKGFTIPMLAKGGVLASSGTVMVGERGPELLTLPTGAQVTPLSRVGDYSMNGKSDDSTEVVEVLLRILSAVMGGFDSVQANGLSERDLARLVRKYA